MQNICACVYFPRPIYYRHSTRSQALSFMLLGSFGVALLVLVAACVPISDPMILGGDHLIWILWLVAPLLATSFLASPSDGSLMKRTPEKNDPKASQQANKCILGTSTLLATSRF